MTPPKRLAEEASLDPWADIAAHETKMSVMQMEAKIEREKRESERKADRREMFWRGLGWVSGTAVVLAAACFLIMLWMNAAKQHGIDSIAVEKERTAQVEACTSLEEPIERQFCLIALNMEAIQKSDNND
jgi:hypothetical protein